MLINDRFDVNSSRNEVVDKQTGKVNRVEPRLIKLLCLLAENEGKAVSRKIIVKEIWDDYPGGDEGLNQAISVLRKLLNDSQKNIIETLPKTGYCFHGTIGSGQIVIKRKPSRLIYMSAAVFLVLMLAFVLAYYYHSTNNQIIPHKLSHEESVKAFEIDSKSNSRKESEQPQRTDDQQRKAAGQADSLRK